MCDGNIVCVMGTVFVYINGNSVCDGNNVCDGSSVFVIGIVFVCV